MTVSASVLRGAANLACGVDDLREERLPFVDDLMAECILYRGIVAFDKVALAVLNRQGGFACAPAEYVSPQLSI